MAMYVVLARRMSLFLIVICVSACAGPLPETQGMTPEEIAQFSVHRLQGEALPHDLELLLQHEKELRHRTGIEMDWREGWAPWLDTSYLSEAERADPGISANVRAITEVCQLIAFVAATEEGEYIGYWRGPRRRLVAESPLVVLDNEGQFRISAGHSLAEAILAQSAGFAGFDELRDWLRALDIAVTWETDDDMTWQEEEHDPTKLHEELYYRYLAGGGPTRP